MTRFARWLVLSFAASVAAQTPTAALVGTVLDPDGKPVANASLRVARCDGRSFRCLDLALRNEWIDVARAKSDKNGRFGVQVPHGLALRVEVDVPPFAIWASESMVPGENQVVQLETACSIAGQCVQAATGKGTPCALRAWNPKTQVALFAGRTDADGKFRFERLPSGPYWCDIDPDEAARPDWIESSLAPGETQTPTWPCDAGVELSGVVTDAATGEPIAGARVGEGWTFDKAVRTDAAGRYTMRGFGGKLVHDIHAEAPGYPPVRIDKEGSAAGPVQTDFALERGVRVVGRVVDAAGKPLPNAYVAAIGSTGMTVPWLPCRTGADGEFVCDGFPRRTEGVLMVRCFSHASVVYVLAGAAADGQIDFGTVALPKPRVVRGFARNQDGSPAAGVQLSLRGVNADVDRFGPLPSAWQFLCNYVGERLVRTDANGAFAFGDVPPGEYGLAFGSRMDATPSAETVTVTAGADPAPITLER